MYRYYFLLNNILSTCTATVLNLEVVDVNLDTG
eukprot:SAG11_NODE_43777_length_161_cov_343.177419_1_plen_32_part_10